MYENPAAVLEGYFAEDEAPGCQRIHVSAQGGVRGESVGSQSAHGQAVVLTQGIQDKPFL
jgi:hypothetical protein